MTESTNAQTIVVVMFIAQCLFGVVMLLIGIVMNGMRASLKEVATDLKKLNNAVLGEYATRASLHELRNQVSARLDQLQAKQQILEIALERHGVQMRRSDVAGPPG